MWVNNCTVRASMCLFIAATYCNVVLGQDNAIFGIQIGQPLALHDCTKGVLNLYDPRLSHEICALLDKGKDEPWGGKSYVVWFPAEKAPDYLNAERNTAQVGVFDGLVGRVYFSTSGETSQQEVLEILTKKFRKPTTQSIGNYHNKMGATVTGINAEWTLPNLLVGFKGIASSIDEGWVDISTPQAHEAVLKWKEKSDSEKIQM